MAVRTLDKLAINFLDIWCEHATLNVTTMAQKDFYSVLGVSKGAAQKDVRSAYRKLAREHHPDVNPGDKAAEVRFKAINAAYEVLSDADKRKKYDKYGDQWEHAGQIEEMQRQRGAGSRTYRTAGDGGNVRFEFGDLSGLDGSADLGSLFGNIFGQSGGQRGQPQRRNVETPIEISLEEAFAGTARTLQLVAESPCASCGGQGRIGDATCHVCEGNGVIAKPRRIEVKIPAGVDNGSRVRVAGEGGMGDLLLVVSVRPHAKFERKGASLITDVDVPVTTAVLGDEVAVPTLTGKVILKVPPLSQNGKQIQLSGLGMPALSGGKRGDLLARLRVRLPEQLSDEEKQLFEQLRTLQGQGSGVEGQG